MIPALAANTRRTEPMSEPTKIWVVESGDSYDDHSVDAIFADEEDARAAVASGFGSRVDFYELYEAGQRPVKAAKVTFVLQLSAITGEPIVTSGNRSADVYENHSEHLMHPLAANSIDANAVAFGQDEWRFWNLSVTGPDNEQTRKVFDDLVANKRAEIGRPSLPDETNNHEETARS